MRTLLIAGSQPVPPKLRELIDQGSTSVREQAGSDAARPLTEFDRVVFWAAAGDEALEPLVTQYARQEAAARREVLVFVSPDSSGWSVPGLSPNEVYSWPRDQDRLEIAFLTGA
jgi:hypothetical protein